MRALARTYTKDAITRLAFWMESDNAKASVSASVALLDRGWGKPAIAVTGADGGAIQAVLKVINNYVVPAPAGSDASAR